MARRLFTNRSPAFAHSLVLTFCNKVGLDSQVTTLLLSGIWPHHSVNGGTLTVMMAHYQHMQKTK
jgi:hypothetical protein